MNTNTEKQIYDACIAANDIEDGTTIHEFVRPVN